MQQILITPGGILHWYDPEFAGRTVYSSGYTGSERLSAWIDTKRASTASRIGAIQDHNRDLECSILYSPPKIYVQKFASRREVADLWLPLDRASSPVMGDAYPEALEAIRQYLTVVVPELG